MSSLKHYFYFIIIYLFLTGVALSNSGGPAGNYANNAPSYNNCTQCHNGAVNTGNGNISIQGLPSDGYTPGELYSLTVKVIGTNSRGYGFQMASQVGNDNAGTFSLGSSSENAELNGNRVQHSTRTVSGEWIVEWLAPSSDVGDITFSLSGLATGGNSSTGGDNVYASAVTLPASTPQETDLFISEYVERSSGSYKAIEIYNPSESAVDLSGYTIKQAAGGAGWGFHPSNGEVSGFIHSLTGSIASGDVYVLAADQASGLEAVVDIALGYPSVCHFAGDDAVGLFYNDELIDVIGVPSVDPGDSWDVAGVSGATEDHRLVRKPTVTTGNTDWATSAGTTTENSEWVVDNISSYGPSDFLVTLGSHAIAGGENISPIVNAGGNQTVLLGSFVTLDGSLSTDPDGTIESYEWSQTTGASVELSSVTEPVVTFIAPSSSDSLSFTLTVTDNEGASSSATAYVKTVQGASTAIFFSEYAEGSSNNKYLEIYNNSGSDIDLGQYAISSCSNGCPDASSWQYPSNIEFDSGTIVAAGDVYVIAHPQADPMIRAEADYTDFLYLSNGDDVFGLVDASSGVIIDIIGERGPDPGDGWDVGGISTATKDHVLIRKSSVSSGNSDWASSAGSDAASSEWEVLGYDEAGINPNPGGGLTVYESDNWINLGSPSIAEDGPVVAISSILPVFLTDQNEIEFSAAVTVPTGSVSSVIVKYGTNDQLVNEAEMYQDNGDIWAGTVPAQQGNIVLQMRVFATSSEGAEGQSAVVERVIASSSPSQIADLYTNQSSDELVTVKGIVTIGGSGLLYPTQTKAYIQDASGRGLQLFDYNLVDGLDRGDEVEVVGYSGYYNTTYQIKDFVFRELSSGNDIPEPISVTAAQANSSNYEGTLIAVTGNITEVTPISTTGNNYTIDDITEVMIWNSTGIDISNLIVGFRGEFVGVGSQYNESFQLLVGYDSDISTVVGVDQDDIILNKFSLLPAYPNPFNPVTNISFVVDKSSEISLKIFDVNGKLVQVVNPKTYQSGVHNIQWNASSLSSGMYFIHMLNGVERYTQKVMLLK